MSDLINGQDAIKACFDTRCASIYDISDLIEMLPSAEPEIIYCKDCQKHNVSIEDWYDNRWKKVCPLVGYRGKAQGHEFDYQFCAYADRRNDEC